MEKTAQKRGPLTKLREMINVPTEKLMGAFSPQFIELMDNLRDTDDNIREQAKDLKSMVKLAKTNFNRREYMVSVSYLGQFQEKMETIYNELSKLGTAADVKHHEFLFGDLDPEHIKYLTEKMGPKFTKYPAPLSRKAEIEKEAGITDWWHNITTDRGKALASWEKKFPKESKELKRQIANMISKSEGLLTVLLSSLKVMASFRATRRLEDYLKEAAKFKQKYRAYHSLFATFYNTYIKKFVDMQKAQMEAAQIDQAQPEQIAEPVAAEPIAVADPNKPKEPVAFVNMKARTEAIKKWIAEHPGEQITPEIVAGLKYSIQPSAPKVDIMPRQQSAFPVPFSRRDLKDVPEQFREEEAKRRKQDVEAAEQYNAPDTVPPSAAPPTLRSKSHNTLLELEEEEPKTLRSRQLPTSHRDRPIYVSMDDSPIVPEENMYEPVSDEELIEVRETAAHQEFLNKLDKFASEGQFILSAELIKYANKIKDSDAEVSKKLLQLSKKVLAG